ncbi:MAG: SDR family oxidoreductase, partial [Geminicoccaceae bacterium]|nr:SDR family oxidoreductase [Geminicoccaceae bacterium]
MVSNSCVRWLVLGRRAARAARTAVRPAARRPLAGAAVASASCGAVESFMRAMVLDLAPIRVNVIQPGYVDTP